MSKFYDRTLKASGSVSGKPVEASIVDRWLEGVHLAVPEQVGGLEPAVVAASVDTETLSGVPEFQRSNVSEFSLEKCRRVTVNSSERFMLPGTVVEQHIVDGFRTLRTRLMRRKVGTDVRIIVTSGAAQGDGKTTTAINLALIWAQLITPRILLVDADLRSAGLSCALGLPEGAGLSDVLSTHARYQEAVNATQIPNLFVIGAGERPDSAPELFASDNWKSFIRWASSTFDLVLIDTPPMLPFPDYELISVVAEGVLVVARQHRTHITQLKNSIAHTDPKKILGVVFNGVKNAKSVDYKSYARYNKQRW